MERLFEGRYQWVNLNNLKVSPRVLDAIRAKRSFDEGFRMEAGRRLAVLIPFRDREAHLEELLPRLRATLDAQEIDYMIYVVEQNNRELFNKGRLYNAAVLEIGDAYDYYCFHDVDLLPADASYQCPSAPLRLANRIRTSEGQRVFSNVYFGGVFTLRREHYLAINGFSNAFWHWGKEDDNFLLRILLAGLNPAVDTLGTFDETDDSSDRFNVYREEGRQVDPALGRAYTRLNRVYQYKVARGIVPASGEGLHDVEYTLDDVIEHPTHSVLRIDVGQPGAGP